MFKRKNTYIALLFLIVLFISLQLTGLMNNDHSVIGVSELSIPENEGDNNQKNILFFIEENIDEIAKMNNNLLLGNWLSIDPLAIINEEITISKSEFIFRKRLNEMDEVKLTSDQIVNLLIEEKLIFMEAFKQGNFKEKEMNELLEQILSSYNFEYRSKFYEYEKYKIIKAYSAVKLQSSMEIDLNDYLEDKKRDLNIKLFLNSEDDTKFY